MLEHGGRLLAATSRYGRPPDGWVDLSTGINPHPWPVPALPLTAWSRLPEDEDGLIGAACEYYDAATVLPVAGSQAAIQALPVLRPGGRVAVLAPGYAEHELAWRGAGHVVTLLDRTQINVELDRVDTLVVINPNNPTGVRFDRDDLLRWYKALAARGGWLVVDEAFMDATPGESVVPQTRAPGLIVLRSLGKFFGLAGARVGFVIAEPSLLQALAEHLGPWALAGPSRYVARQALLDRSWHAVTRARLHRDSHRLAGLLAAHGLAPTGGTALFQWVCTPRAPILHDHLARWGVWTRCFTEPTSLRFGLPGAERQWDRLAGALAACVNAPAQCEGHR